MSTDVASTYEELKHLASEDMSEALKSQSEVDSAIGALSSSNDALRESVEQAITASERLSGEIGRAVMGLQFQDAVNQRIAHVVEALAELEGSLRSHLAGVPEPETGWGAELQRAYTMRAEREVQAQVTGAPVGGADATSTVELF